MFHNCEGQSHKRKENRSRFELRSLCLPAYRLAARPNRLTLANAAIVAFVLLRNSRFNFHCYTPRVPTATPTSARKWQLRPFATSCAKEYEGYIFTLANQLSCISQCVRLPQIHVGGEPVRRQDLCSEHATRRHDLAGLRRRGRVREGHTQNGQPQSHHYGTALRPV